MPEQETLRRAERDKRQGKAASTQAGEFVREELHHIREGKHGAKSTKQVIAIGLSKARRAGVKLTRRPTFARQRKSAAARGSPCGLTQGSGTTGDQRGQATIGGVATWGGAESGADQGTASATAGGA